MKIYALVDPRDDSVRYVGRTVSALRVRLSAHVTDARTYLFEGKPQNCTSRKAAWVRELKAAGQQPRIRLLARVRIDQGVEAERQWIAMLLEAGAPLVNGNLRNRARDEWLCGYAAALASTYRNFHDRSLTTKTLQADGITLEQLRTAGAEERDLEQLAKALRE